MKQPGAVIALVGAESTGKTALSKALRNALAGEGRDAVVVAECLREFCEHEGRTPTREEQPGLAAEQTRRIEAASERHEIVVADTTALMVAVYSDQVFGDTSLYASAEAAHAGYRATLLTALDLPWHADGFQRDGPQVRAPVDARLRAALQRAGAPYSVVSGIGPARLAAALAAVRRALNPPPDDAAGARWRWVCERCGDAHCEQHLLPPMR